MKLEHISPLMMEAALALEEYRNAHNLWESQRSVLNEAAEGRRLAVARLMNACPELQHIERCTL